MDIDLFNVLERAQRSSEAALFAQLEGEIAEALNLYWSIGREVLKDSGIELLDPPSEFRTLRKNFFSALFLYSYHRASIPLKRRVSYAAINHCLRGMVTGCDNILDDEYKPTLFTNLPEAATKFRSVLDIMVSDRILFEILLRIRVPEGLDPKRIFQASAASLRALTWSGAQEASEEGGTKLILEPERIVNEVHHFKTGILFQCPWAVPLLVEPDGGNAHAILRDALYWIGMGCQILDDMVDFASDLERHHHNFLISLIEYGPAESEKNRLRAIRRDQATETVPVDLSTDFPGALSVACTRATSYLHRGLGALFPRELSGIIPAITATLATLIGARRFLERD